MAESTVLLSSIVEQKEESNGFTTTRFSLMGDAHASAIVAAARYDYHRVTNRPVLTDEDLAALAGSKVTITRAGESMFGAGSIQAQEGTVFLGSGGQVALLPKGKRKKGIVLKAAEVLDVEIGYNRQAVLQARIDAVRATYPKLEALTQEHLNALPEEAPSPAQIGLVVFGTWRGPDNASPGAIWFVHSYMHEDDIAEGYLIVRPEHGMSEHGSIYGNQLLKMGGRVTDARALSFDEAMALGDLPYDQALARITA